jgi:IS5 family transposase
MKNINPTGLFDDYFILEKLTELNDPLFKLNQYIDWNIFYNTLHKHYNKLDIDKSKGGRPSFDRLMLFKALIIQSLYNLSDEQLEYQILDRNSFKRFMGLKKSDKVPDSRTYWAFREELIQNELVHELFEIFNTQLDRVGIIASEGRMIDASFVETPRQRNTREENAQVKSGQTPSQWTANPHKLAQKDIDARWTQKNKTNFYGYKNHVKGDTKTKLIVKYIVTDASVHDSQAIDQLLDDTDKGQELYADSAYTGETAEELYKKAKIINRVHEKGYKNKPLSESQQASNKEKSRTRVRVEHIFGFVENSMNGSYIRTIGLKRATAKIGLMNLVYNLCRCVQLKKQVRLWDTCVQLTKA